MPRLPQLLRISLGLQGTGSGFKNQLVVVEVSRERRGRGEVVVGGWGLAGRYACEMEDPEGDHLWVSEESREELDGGDKDDQGGQSAPVELGGEGGHLNGNGRHGGDCEWAVGCRCKCCELVKLLLDACHCV